MSDHPDGGEEGSRIIPFVVGSACAGMLASIFAGVYFIAARGPDYDPQELRHLDQHAKTGTCYMLEKAFGKACIRLKEEKGYKAPERKKRREP